MSRSYTKVEELAAAVFAGAKKGKRQISRRIASNQQV